MPVIGNAANHQQPLAALITLAPPLLAHNVHAQRVRRPRARVLLDQRQEVGQDHAQRVTGARAVAEKGQKLKLI